MVDSRLLQHLRRIAGPEHVSDGAVHAELYAYDASTASRPAAAVVFPADTAQTAAVVRALSAAGVPFIPRGFGTNLSGGSVAAEGGVVVCLSRLSRILSVDVASRCAVVQPGVTNLELQQCLAGRGYFYAPDPASQKVATIGGNIGENSGGPHCLKYGVTTNHILGLTAVLPDGEVVELGGPALDPPGLDLRGALVGSEGTLAIVTEATVRILPQPEDVVTLLVIYDDVAAAAQSVSDVIAAGIVPATLEMMDAPVIRAVEQSLRCGYPLDAEAALIIEVDGPAAGLREQAARIEAICRRHGCRSVREAADADERNLLWAGRRGAFGAIARLAPNFLVNDCTVPRSRLPEALARVGAIARDNQLPVGNVFHAGDGNLHPLLLFDSRNQDEVQRVHRAGWQIMEACVALGGTISGEHGIGAEKLEAMRLVFTEASLQYQRGLKEALDPAGLLNPGKVVPPPRVGPPGPEPGPERLRPGADLVPVDAAAACDLVRRAARDGVALLPRGRGTRLRLTSGLPDGVAALRSERLRKLEHDPVNQVVAVGAGVSLSDLQQALRPHRQWVPLRPPLSHACTVGGAVALGACGPDRLRYGAPRDLLLGLEFVSGRGLLVAAGGRVVKNVAGYDVTRLLAGSRGALGFLTEVTLRTYLLPEAVRVLEGAGSPAQCAAAALGLLDSRLEPAYLVAVAAPAGTGAAPEWRFAAGFEGAGPTVCWQADRGREVLRQAGLGSLSSRESDPGQDVFLDRWSGLCAAPWVVRVALPPRALAGFLEGALAELGAAGMLVDYGTGQVTAALLHLPGDTLGGLAAQARERQGHLAIEPAPAREHRAPRDSGPGRPDQELGLRVARALDPDGVFAWSLVSGG
ncbi:MAG: FAD-linked oxidase C-terminal domain-containing protein [Gemmatimonadota bacterium]